jgi:hypothetical protein
MRLRLGLLLCALLVGAVTIVQQDALQAQDSCPVLVQSALEQMGDNCGDLGRNSACYGYTRVDSTFLIDAPLDFFSQPSDRAALAQIESLTTAPLDLDLDQWGIAVMNVQANVPGALPGQSVTFMLMGDTEIDNTVPPDEMLPAGELVEVLTQIETPLSSGPVENASTVALLPSGALLEAEGVTPDGDWLRAYSDQGLGWVSREAVEVEAALDSLPVVTADTRPPMQAFHVRTGISDLLCSEAPSLLAIQSPEGLKVDLMANGVHVRLGSLIILRNLPPGDTLQVITIEGDVVLDPDTPFATQLLPGFATQRCLDDDGNVSDQCGWDTPVPLTEEELIFVETVLLAFQQYNLGSGESLELNGQQFTLIDTDACPAGTTVEYTVQPGDSLYAISLQYNTTVESIRLNNSLDSTVIVPGQTLSVICGERPTAAPPLTSAPPPPPAGDCSGFAATSPLDGLSYGTNTFYWNAPNTPVDQYRVTVRGEAGSASFTTDGSSLNLTAELTYDTVGSGYQFTWTVEALRGNAVICSLPVVTIFRESPPPFRSEPRPTAEPTPFETEEPFFGECECCFCEGDFCECYPCEECGDDCEQCEYYFDA